MRVSSSMSILTLSVQSQRIRKYPMQPNYRYVIEKIAELAPDDDLVILDYGCGLGEIVERCRELNIRAFGVEKFYAGANSRQIAEERRLLGDVIHELEDDGRIPFDDEYFDLVVSNQVFEHVEDLENVVKEVARVLKPNGSLLCLFPSKGILREVHCGIPIVHWLPKRSKIRYYWLLLFRGLGFGYHKAGKSRRAWAADFTDWLQSYTHYRSRGTIKKVLAQEFATYRSLEDEYVAFRLTLKGLTRSANIVRWPVIGVLIREVCRRYGGLVLLAEKT